MHCCALWRAGNQIKWSGYARLLEAAMDGPAYKWLSSLAATLPRRSLETKRLGTLWGSTDRIMSRVRQQHKSHEIVEHPATPPSSHLGPRRASLIVLGPQAVGKTSLLWRLQHPDPAIPLLPMQSTNGIAMGKCARFNVLYRQRGAGRN